MLLLLLLSNAAATPQPREWPPSGYKPDPDWKPSAPASLNVSGVSAVACLTHECPEVYVAQRGGSKPIVVLDSKTGAYLRAFGDNTTGGSLFGKIHGLRASSRHGPVAGGADLWATDAKASKILGFNGGTGKLVTSFGSRGTGTHPQLQFGSVADLAFSQNGSEMFISDGDGGINSRVARLTATSSGGASTCSVKPEAPPVYKPTCAAAAHNQSACDALSMTCRWGTSGGAIAWETTWVTSGDKYSSPSNFSSPHSVAYDACWDAVFVADRNHQRVVQLQGRLGSEYTPSWDLKCLLGYHYDNISDPLAYAVWSVRTAQTMSKDHVGKLFVGIVRCLPPTSAPLFFPGFSLRMSTLAVGRRRPHSLLRMAVLATVVRFMNRVVHGPRGVWATVVAHAALAGWRIHAGEP
jgi:hypothetical protein